MVCLDIGGCGPYSLGIRGQHGAQISIFLVSRQYFMERCMDLSKIIPQGSIPEKDGYEWLKPFKKRGKTRVSWLMDNYF